MMYHLLYLDIKQYTWDKEGEGGQINPPPAFPGFQVPSRYKVKLTGEFFIFFGIFFLRISNYQFTVWISGYNRLN